MSLYSLRRRAPKLGLPIVLALAIAACGGSDSPVAPVTTLPQPSPSPVAPAVSPAGLTLLLHMDEPTWGAARDVRDSSGLGHHGSATSGATTVADGRFGRGGSFPGGAGCVSIPDDASLRPSSELTVAAWISPDGIGRGAAMGIAAKRVNFQVSSAYAFFVGTNDRLSVDVDTEDDRFDVTPTLANGRWYHVAMVYDGAAQSSTVYVAGAAVGAHSESARSIRSFTSPLWVGCLAEGTPSQGFAGRLDELAIWHRALSAAEIQALANATAPLANP